VVEQNGRPDKKSYAINAAGTAHLEDWIAQPTSSSPMKDELLTKLFVGHLAPIEILLQRLKESRSQHTDNLATHHTIAQQFFPDPATLSLQLRCQYLTPHSASSKSRK